MKEQLRKLEGTWTNLTRTQHKSETCFWALETNRDYLQQKETPNTKISFETLQKSELTTHIDTQLHFTQSSWQIFDTWDFPPRLSNQRSSCICCFFRFSKRDSDWSVRPDSDMCPSKEDHYKFVFWTPSQPVSKWNCTSRR